MEMCKASAGLALSLEIVCVSGVTRESLLAAGLGLDYFGDITPI